MYESICLYMVYLFKKSLFGWELHLHVNVYGNKIKVTVLGRLNFKLQTSIYLQAKKRTKTFLLVKCVEEINEVI